MVADTSQTLWSRPYHLAVLPALSHYESRVDISPDVLSVLSSRHLLTREIRVVCFMSEQMEEEGNCRPYSSYISPPASS